MKTDINNRLSALQPTLFVYAYKLTGEKESAGDLLQDTNLRILDNREKFVNDTSFKGWCFTIMKNQFINDYRKAKRTKVYLDHSENNYFIDIPQTKGANECEIDYDMKQIMKETKKLPFRLRGVFEMYLSGFKYCEISEKLNIPLGTTRSRIHYARKMVVENLGISL